jgi:hypothetical protein
MLAGVAGLKLKEMQDSEVCCGFGGTFCVKYPEISEKMVEDKIHNIIESGADTLLGGDLGCLMNIAGRLRRVERRCGYSIPPKCWPEWPTAPASAAIQRGVTLMEMRSKEFKSRAVFAIHDASLQQAMGKARDGFVGKRAQQAAELPEFEALREEAKNLKNHILENLDHYLERYEDAVKRAGGQVHWARDAEEARDDHPGHLQAGECQDGHQGQVDGVGGDRPQRGADRTRHGGGRDRSGRIHHPARQRTAIAHHRAGGAQDQGIRSPTCSRPPTAGRARPKSPIWSTRRARCCAKNTSAPTSASPAATS